MKKMLGLLLCLPLTALAVKMPCSNILSKPVQQYIKHYTKLYGSTTLDMIQALQTYQTCYQQQTQALSQHLAKQGNGPLMGAMGNYKDFQLTLNKFETYALSLVATGGTYDQLNTAYINLYKSTFAKSFYQSYQQSNKIMNDKKQLTILKNKFTQQVAHFDKIKQHKLTVLFNNMDQAWVQGVNGNVLLPYQFALSILQSAGEKPLVQPML